MSIIRALFLLAKKKKKKKENFRLIWAAAVKTAKPEVRVASQAKSLARYNQRTIVFCFVFGSQKSEPSPKPKP